ncbi:hypothetical protein H9Q09_00865 [Aurantimonas sp. DM33-3]|uniref:hypothetical protein n=1 Tax=Aurantimonas sp. DM33-3 TaxID=2766955 RepID=UPI001651C402|nr:hypothetical protein [Aurantimonas sp. DM33-3]MBC6714735.1 hypothetical protein [Aurantimonas sp. DM33-3]
MRSLVAAIIVAGAAPALAASGYDAVKDMTAQEYNELGLFVRSELLQPYADEVGVEYQHLNACIKVAGHYPDTQVQPMKAILPDCVQWARERAR